MDKSTRNAIERATQQARKLLDEDFSSQLEGTFDVLRSGVIAPSGGVHLSARQQFQRGQNRRRDRTQACRGDDRRGGGQQTMCAMPPLHRSTASSRSRCSRRAASSRNASREVTSPRASGSSSGSHQAPCSSRTTDTNSILRASSRAVGQDIGVLFDRRDPAGLLWPRRQALNDLLTILNDAELLDAWNEDETIGWVYQYFNSGDERKKMRDASQAPRNSRELAVRNQFFTPRYVVQFLADNTLGRLWLEMQGEKTALAKRCEYLVRTTDEPTQPRPKQDPRDLRILDPACGSGHFLLTVLIFCWRSMRRRGRLAASAPQCESTGRDSDGGLPGPCRPAPSGAPRLIVEHNLYGVDIDPTLRADRGLGALAAGAAGMERSWMLPHLSVRAIRRTHIVVAEPMPGDAASG